jgi:hypothetical protein
MTMDESRIRADERSRVESELGVPDPIIGWLIIICFKIYPWIYGSLVIPFLLMDYFGFVSIDYMKSLFTKLSDSLPLGIEQKNIIVFITLSILFIILMIRFKRFAGISISLIGSTSCFFFPLNLPIFFSVIFSKTLFFIFSFITAYLIFSFGLGYSIIPKRKITRNNEL